MTRKVRAHLDDIESVWLVSGVRRSVEVQSLCDLFMSIRNPFHSVYLMMMMSTVN